MRSLVLIFAVTAIALGQHGPGGHGGQVDARYTMTPMPPPKLMSGIGISTLKITTKSAAAQAYFSQGMELLHCFWDFEAYRAFKEAARLDPDAPIAYWGILRAIREYPGMEDEGKQAVATIKSLMKIASDHETYYLREFSDDSRPKPTLWSCWPKNIRMTWMRKRFSGYRLRAAMITTISQIPGRWRRTWFLKI